MCLFQETHCTSNLETVWQAEWGAKMNFSNGQSNARGLAILMARDSPFIIQELCRDEEGRVILIKIERGSESFILGNIYTPTQDQPEAQMQLIDWVEVRISELGPANILLGGDLNICLDPDLERNGRHNSLPWASAPPPPPPVVTGL